MSTLKEQLAKETASNGLNVGHMCTHWFFAGTYIPGQYSLG